MYRFHKQFKDNSISGKIIHLDVDSSFTNVTYRFATNKLASSLIMNMKVKPGMIFVILLYVVVISQRLFHFANIFLKIIYIESCVRVAVLEFSV